MIPAVVVGSNLNALGVIRSLRHSGMPLYTVDTTWRRPAMWSRGCVKVVVNQLYGRALVNALLDLHRRIGERAVLFLTDEMSVYTVSEYRDELARAYRFRVPSHETVFALSDKASFQQIAERNGFPVPRSVALTTASDLHKLRALEFPVIIKPTDKRRVHTGATERLHRAHTLAEAEALCARILPAARGLIVQEWVPGPDSSIYFTLFYRGGGGALSMFTGRKLASHPPAVGSTAICVAAPEVRDMLEPLTRAFIETVGFDGMGSIEFKWDCERKRFVMIEPTVARTDWQEEIATLCGVNIPLFAYCHEIGLPVDAASDVKANFAWRTNAAQSWPQDHPRGDVRVIDGLWRLDDPAPALFFYGFEWALRRLLKPFRIRQHYGLGRSIEAEKASSE